MKRVFDILVDVCTSGKMFPGVVDIQDKGDGHFYWILADRNTLGKTFQGRYTTHHENNGKDEVRWKTVDGNVKTGGVWTLRGRDGAVELAVEAESTVDAPVPSILKKPAQLFADREMAGGVKKQLENIKKAAESS